MKYKLLKITIIIIAILLLIISLIFTKPKLMGYLIVYDGYTNYNNKIMPFRFPQSGQPLYRKVCQILWQPW